MTTSMLRAVAVAAALSLGGVAAAEPIQVEYFVDQKAFKSGVTGTDVLDFVLYADEDCTTEIGSYPVFANDEYVHFFIDKKQRIRGGRKLPKAIRIRAVIDAPTTVEAPYLLVNGPGITPVGEACQLQSGSPIAAVGPQGDSGPAGPEGPMGPAGADGATGPAGADGATGPQGEVGPAGPEGPAGPMGPAGADGATGPAGADGATGPQGEAGPAGLEGPVGPMGPAGADGAAGPAGADGATGPQGEPGPAGPEGPMGPAGPAGATGPQGEPGPAGPEGPMGPQGPQGETGPAGPSGVVLLLLGGGSGGENLSPSATTYLPLYNAAGFNAEAAAAQVVPVSGTISKLHVHLNDAPGDSYEFYVRINGSNTALTCTITGAAATTCSDPTNSVAITAGDELSIGAVPISNPSSRRMGWTAVLEQ